MSSFGSIRSVPTLNRLETERSTWLVLGVSSVLGGRSGAVSVDSAPGAMSPPTTQPCAAELPGHDVYRVADVTVSAPARPLIAVKFGAPAPPAVRALVPSV